MSTTTVVTALRADNRPQRWLHPGAWWIWALGLATAASRTTDPLLLVLIISVAGVVVAARKPQAPWARSFAVFVKIGVVIIVIRIVFQVLIGTPQGTTVLIDLPAINLPGFLAGVRLGGQLTLESLVAAFYDGLRLAAVLACVGAASSLASPYRLLKAMPAALYEVGVSVVVALSFAPALVTDVQRVRVARTLRGRPSSGLRGLAGSVMPVFASALDRSISLAAAMDSRGYGRIGNQPAMDRRINGLLVLGGLVGIAWGLYALLDGSASGDWGLPLLIVGVVGAAVGFVRSGKRNIRTKYRPDPWRTPEWLTSLSGVGTAGLVITAGVITPGSLAASVTPLAWPNPPLLAVVGILLGLLPAVLTPQPPNVQGRMSSS